MLAKKLIKPAVYLDSTLSGRYGSASEVIRSALRLLDNQETKWQSLRQLLIDGEQRGDADYDLEHFIHALDSDNAQCGRLSLRLLQKPIYATSHCLRSGAGV